MSGYYKKHVPFITNDGNQFIDKNNEEFYVRVNYEGSQKIVLYKNSAENNRIDKSNFIENIGHIWGIFRDSVSVTKPVILIQYDKVPDFNYVYLESLNRYYYVVNYDIENSYMYNLYLREDVLMSNKDAIMGLTAFVDRNEFVFNEDLIDKNRVIEQGVDVEVLTANVTPFKKVTSEDPCVVINGYKFGLSRIRPLP